MADEWGESTTSGGWGDSNDTWGGDTNNNETGGGGGSDKGCRICHEEGHFARECPKKGERKKGCFKCGEEGHNKADCPNPGNAGGGDGDSKKGCFKCGEEGHNKADCPQNEGETKKGCFKCGGDHMAKDCEQPDKCRACGEEGHLSKDCTTGPVTHTVTKEDGTKTEIYIPPEIGEESLFEQGISSGINFDKFDNIPVKCSGQDAPNPLPSFEAMDLRKILLDNIGKSGYKKPTPIQKSAIPAILKNRDLMACAQTGSGKTAAFLLPILHKLLEDGCEANAGDSPQKPQALIVTPTRELAIQIKDEARKFAQGSMIKAVVAYGGTSTGFQMTQLFKGTNLLIATPGRLMDIVEKGKVSFEGLRYLVLDEADRMLDMGFHPEVIRITSHSTMPKKGERRTLMFSATFPEAVQQLALEFLENYLFLSVGIVGGASSDVTQTFLKVEKFQKREKLIEILKDVGSDRTLVFVETKRNADFLASVLSNEGLPTTSIHGDRLQREREEALRDFKVGKMPILIATAVAARGLDIKGVAHVINYDLPKSIDEYVHRIGRTGRVGNTGKATSFFDQGENGDLGGSLIRILSECKQEVPDFLTEGSSMGADGASGFGGVDIRGGTAVQTNAAVDDDDEW